MGCKERTLHCFVMDLDGDASGVNRPEQRRGTRHGMLRPPLEKRHSQDVR